MQLFIIALHWYFLQPSPRYFCACLSSIICFFRVKLFPLNTFVTYYNHPCQRWVIFPFIYNALLTNICFKFVKTMHKFLKYFSKTLAFSALWRSQLSLHLKTRIISFLNPVNSISNNPLAWYPLIILISFLVQ